MLKSNSQLRKKVMTRLRQILINLVNNAIKFTSRGEIVIYVRRRESLEAETVIEFEVRDTGIGIATDNLGRIFEPFVQAESDLNRRYEGTGLGLPLAKSLVELHGGRIALESTPNEGTRVSVVFPADRLVDPAPMQCTG